MRSSFNFSTWKVKHWNLESWKISQVSGKFTISLDAKLNLCPAVWLQVINCQDSHSRDLMGLVAFSSSSQGEEIGKVSSWSQACYGLPMAVVALLLPASEVVREAASFCGRKRVHFWISQRGHSSWWGRTWTVSLLDSLPLILAHSGTNYFLAHLRAWDTQRSPWQQSDPKRI